jgi:tetratricopeptide (TPR) repeat protein
MYHRGRRKRYLMVKIDELLKEAHSFFSAKEFDKALFMFSQVLSYEPDNETYKLYCILCDLGFDNAGKAQNLYDYFEVTKSVNLQEALDYVHDIINAYDGDNDKMMDIFQDISKTSIESLNAIDYKDFMKLVESRGSFKEAYQDIMFSTKVAITSKEDLIDFINKLIDNNFNKTAYKYLDGFNEYFSFDDEVTSLYEKLERKNIEDVSKQ